MTRLLLDSHTLTRLLLDSHTFLWHADNDPRLSANARTLLIDPANDLSLSLASVWELAIKVGMKKLKLTPNFEAYVSRVIDGYAISVLPISIDDCCEYEKLAFPNPKHRDPFDRMIVTHATRQLLTVVSADHAFDAYGVSRVW